MKPQYFELSSWPRNGEEPPARIDVWPLFREYRWDSTQLRVETLFKNSIRVVIGKCLRCELCGDYLRPGERTIGSRMHACHFWDVFVPEWSSGES
jgi:hypothetical protein